MRVVTFSDIHANIHALDAVLANLAQHKADHVVCLGDLVGYGAFPNEVILRLRELGIPTIQGNYDDGVGYDRDDCGCAYREEKEAQRGQQSLPWHREHVTAENKAFLRSLLPRVEYDIEAAAQAIEKSGLPAEFAQHIRTGIS